MKEKTNFAAAHQVVKGLVDQFEANLAHYLSADYQEQELRHDFLDKLFIALGWDVNHETQTNPYAQEVKIEKSVTTGTAKRRADYAFSLAPQFNKRPRFFVEAKRPQHDIATPDNYFQAIRYSWSHQLPVVVLTDFNSFHIIDSRFKPNIKSALPRQLAVYHFREFRDADTFAKIYWLFSREATLGDAIGQYAQTLEKPGTQNRQLGQSAGGFQNIDDAFLGLLDQYREDLARSFKRLNPQLDSEQLTEAVQRTLDRLVFTRFLEDKLIEPAPIISRLGTKTSAWKQFVRDCDRLDKQYNGVVYKHHAILDAPGFQADDTAFLAICDELTDAASPYDFNAIPIEMLGRIYERFLGKVVIANAKEARIEEKPMTHKAGGVYYTPDYIVSYMVEQALGPKVTGKSPAEILAVKTIDTSCGSGSFLIGVYDYLLTELARTYAAQPRLAKKGDAVLRDGVLHLSIQKKREVLTKCIFGIDIDAQAVEVSQLSLYLKLLEDETTASAQAGQLELAGALLPPLHNNIIVGNALISPIDDAAADDMFSMTRFEALRAVNMHRTFPQVMQRGGGFDLVIGNPPYIKEYTHREAFDHLRESPYFQGKMDIWYLFACRALDILKPESGTLALIATNNWTTNFGARRLREKLSKDARIEQLIDFGDFKVFRDAGIQTMILIARRAGTPASYAFDYRVLGGKKRRLEDAQGLLRRDELPQATFMRPIVERMQLGGSPFTFSDAQHTALLRKLLDAANFKLDGKTEVAQGIVPPQDFVNKKSQSVLKRHFSVGQGIFNLDHTEKNSLLLSAAEKRLVKPFYTTQELRRYWSQRTNRLWVIYTDSSFKDPLAINPYPKLKAHLDQFKKVITSDNKPYGLHRSRDENFFKGEKIISVRKCAEPTFSYTDFDCYVSQTFNIIKTRRINLKYLTALLNSNVVRYWLRHKGKMQGDQFQVDKEPLLAIPLIAPTPEMQMQIAKLVDRILQAAEKFNAAVLDRERTQYQRLLEQTDAQIQQHIGTLYGLTEAEIDLVNPQ
ncbi:MAG: Eco57I restriction-modification methylase domain-containing protein [Rhodoferax sp.]|nr:Eco57I restriction-modification methylase domain-containing protein [Rhodoferax sp.]